MLAGARNQVSVLNGTSGTNEADGFVEQAHPEGLIERANSNPLAEGASVWCAHFADAAVDELLHPGSRQLDPERVVRRHSDELVVDSNTSKPEHCRFVHAILFVESRGAVPEEVVGLGRLFGHEVIFGERAPLRKYFFGGSAFAPALGSYLVDYCLGAGGAFGCSCDEAAETGSGITHDVEAVDVRDAEVVNVECRSSPIGR
jgi:hypothetical protein